jgi:integrase
MVTFLSVAKEYLSSKIVCSHYHDTVLRIANACKCMTNIDINDYLKSRLEKCSTITVKTDRTILLALWKFAYENDIIDHMPKKIVKIKIKKPPTKAWTIDECKNMINKTYADHRKNRKGVPVGLWLRVWLLIGYESGARLGDIFSFKWEDIDNNVLRWTMSKTGDPMTKILSDKCIEYIDELKKYNTKKDPRILGWICSKRQAIRVMREFLDKCELFGSSKFLRRSGATHIEINQPGMAKLHLGHRTTGLAEKNYLDFGQIRKHTPITPKLL